MANEKQPAHCLEVSETLKSVLSRIDERVNLIMAKQSEMEKKLEDIHELKSQLRLVESAKDDLEKEVSSLQSTVHTMELGLQQVTIQTEGHEGKWKTIVSFAVQIAWVILAAYLLLKLGIQAPAVP